MRVPILMVIVFVLFGCASEQGRRFLPEEVMWIEKERTTRAEVVGRFGLPPVELPHPAGFTTTTTTKTITAIDSAGHTKTTQTTTQIQRPSQLRKAVYVSTHRDAALFPSHDNVEFTQNQLWVIYDEKGVVRDYGFLGDQPDPAVRQDQQTIATAPQVTDDGPQDVDNRQ